MGIERSYFGKTSDGRDIDLYTLSNTSGIKVGILTYGGIIFSFKVPDKNGQLTDIVLGFDKITDYENSQTYFGALIGRFANRIGKGRFSLEGRTYNLARNNNENHLHGGIVGFNNRIWSADVKDNKLILTLFSPDGEEGYPGNLNVSVAHSLDEDGTFAWEYNAETDKTTLCNLTNHAYFNLSGHDSGSVRDQMLQLHSDAFTETDAGLIPTGNIVPVDGTPMDFRELHAIGERIDEDYEPLKLAGGYDHNFAVRGATGTLRGAASGLDPKSGIAFELKTTLPGVQLYTGNFLNGVKGKNDACYHKNGGFCLETQYFPDGINHENFEQPVLRAGDKFHHITTMKFTVKK